MAEQRILELACQHPILQWTLLHEPSGLAICTSIRRLVLHVAEEENGVACARRLCLHAIRKLAPPLPRLGRLSPTWIARTYLAHVQEVNFTLGVEGLITLEVVKTSLDLWTHPQMFTLNGDTPSTFLQAVAVKEEGSIHAYTTQSDVAQALFPMRNASNQRCTFHFLFAGLWKEWLRQFSDHLQLPLQEQPPFDLPGVGIWTGGRVLFDLRMRNSGGWAHLRMYRFA